MLAAAVPGATEREIDQVVGQAKTKDQPVAWLRAIIRNGDAAANIAQAREQLAASDERAEQRRRHAEAEPVRPMSPLVPDSEQVAISEGAKRLALDSIWAQLGRPNGAPANGHRESPQTTAPSINGDQAAADRQTLAQVPPELYERLLADAAAQLGTDYSAQELVHAAAELYRTQSAP
jgi:hypothetical protein